MPAPPIDEASLLRALAETVPGYVCVVDPELRFLWSNRLRPGLTADDVIGKSVADFVTEESFERGMRCVSQVLKTGEPDFFLAESHHASGEIRWSEGHLACVEGHKDRLLLASRDITEQLRAQERLRDSLNTTRRMIEDFPGFMLLLQPNGTVVAASDAVARAVESEGDLTGRIIYEPMDRVLGTKTTEARRAWIQRILATGEPQHFVEERVDRVFDSTVYPVRKPNGDIGNIAIVSRDITEQHRAAILLQEERERRWHADKMAALGTLSAGIAHDFNNLLTPIVANAHRAMRLDTEMQTRIELIEGIADAAEQAAALVRQILAYSSVDANAQESFDLVPLMQDTVRFARSMTPSNIKIEMNFPEAEMRIMGDPNRLRQAIINLHINAQQAVQPGGGTIDIALESVVITGSRSATGAVELAPGRYAKVSIRDTGCGIPAESLPHIFDPFYSTRSSDQGTGLGLFIVNGVVTEHGGAVTVESSTGSGTRFTLWLPIHEPTLPPVETPRRSASPGQGLTILLVDDQPEVLSALSELLRDDEHTVHAYNSTEAAAAAFVESPQSFDAAVVDYQLCDGNGLDLATRLRAERPDLAILLFSGFVTRELREALKAQNISVALKPNVTGELLDWLARL